MAAIPYMRLYVADYLADTSHLTTFEHGAYLLLIMNYWQRGGSLPADDEKLARIARVTRQQWARMRENLHLYFTIRDGSWVHQRIESELARVRDKSLKTRKAGLTSVERMRDRCSTDDVTCVEQVPTYTDTDTDTDISIISNEIICARDAPVVVKRARRKLMSPLPNKPDGVDAETWDGYRQLRDKKRSPLTQSALNGIIREANKAKWSLEDALRECCMRGWVGFKAEWVSGTKGGNGGQSNRTSGWL